MTTVVDGQHPAICTYLKCKLLYRPTVPLFHDTVSLSYSIGTLSILFSIKAILAAQDILCKLKKRNYKKNCLARRIIIKIEWNEKP